MIELLYCAARGSARRRGRCRGFAGSRVELGTESESLLQMLDEDAHFGRDTAAGGPDGQDWGWALQGREKKNESTISELCSEEPRGCLGDPKMLQDTHPHLFDIAGSKDAGWHNAFGVLSRAEAPGLHRAAFGEDDPSMISEIFRRLRSAVACEVLGSGDENHDGL